MDIAVLFQIANLSKSITVYFDLIDTVSSKINILINSEFDTANNLLKQARNTNSKEAIELIRQSRIAFTKATHLEKGERLFDSYIGLALCCFYLKDYNNYKLALRNSTALEVKLEDGSIELYPPARSRLTFKVPHGSKKTSFSEKQEAVKKYLLTMK